MIETETMKFKLLFRELMEFKQNIALSLYYGIKSMNMNDNKVEKILEKIKEKYIQSLISKEMIGEEDGTCAVGNCTELHEIIRLVNTWKIEKFREQWNDWEEGK